MVAGALALVCLLAPGAAAEAAVVQVQSGSGKTVPVELETLLKTPDVNARTYTIRGAAGMTTTEPLTGVSLAAVLKAAKADDFKLVQIQDGAGNVVEVEGEDAVRTDWGGHGPPVFVVDAQGVRFLRDSTSDADLNEGDQLRGGAGLTVQLRGRSEPRISASASTLRPKVGEKVTFTAQVGGVPSGEKHSVSWLVGAKSRNGESIAHTFREKGTINVIATLILADGTNRSDVLMLKVGEKEKPKPAKEPEDAPGTVTSESTGGTGSGGGGGGTGAGVGAGSGTGTASPAPSASTPAPAASDPAPEKPEPREREREPRKPAEEPVPATIPGEVTGELLVADTAPVADPPRRSIVRAPEAKEPGGDRALGLPPEAWTGIGVGLALAAGFALDRRRLRGIA